MEQLRSLQEPTLGTLDTFLDAVIARGTRAMMDRLDGLLRTRSKSRTRRARLSREPRVNNKELSNRRRTHGYAGGYDNSLKNATGINRAKSPKNMHRGGFY